MTEFCEQCPMREYCPDGLTENNLSLRTNGINPLYSDSRLVIDFVNPDNETLATLTTPFNYDNHYKFPDQIGLREIRNLSEIAVGFIKRKIIERVNDCEGPVFEPARRGVLFSRRIMGIRNHYRIGEAPEKSFCSALSMDALKEILSGAELSREMHPDFYENR